MRDEGNRGDMRDLAQDALELAELGWHVFPLHTWDVDHCDCRRDCQSPAKHPRTRHGLKDASRDKADVIRWWGQWPQANIGVRTGMESGLVVVDVDPRNGGGETWPALRAEHGYEHEGPSCVTGGGGFHLYFRYPEDGKPVLSRSGALGAGVDVKSDGGYVVAPPSVHARGTSYAWVEGYEAWTRGLPAVPEFVLGLARAQDGADGELRTARPVAEEIREGQRRTALLSLAGSMRHRNMGETAIFNALMAENAEKCVPPLDAREVAKLAADAVARWQPGMATIVPSGRVNKETAKQRQVYTPEPKSFASLMHEAIPPMRWAVQGLLPEGVAFLAGAPKLGKSYAALALCCGIAQGEDVFAYFPAQAAGDCLYLALEDGQRRLHTRLKELMPDGAWPERAYYETRWPRLPEGGSEALEAWLGQHPEARLVIIDTFALLKPEVIGRGKSDAYAEDYAAVRGVKEIADRYGVCILLITHRNKGEHSDWVNTMTGTTGLSGSADTLLNMARPEQARTAEQRDEAELRLTGRDVLEGAWALKRSDGWWQVVGDMEEAKEEQATLEVVDFMRMLWEDGYREVDGKLMGQISNRRPATVRQMLARAVRRNSIHRVRQGWYELYPKDRPKEGM